MGYLTFLGCKNKLRDVFGNFEGLKFLDVFNLFEEIRGQLADESCQLLDCVSVWDLIKDSVGGRGLHNFVSKAGELAVGLIANNHAVFVGPLDFPTGQILIT